MKLEYGKYYLARSGQMFGPLHRTQEETVLPGFDFTDGRFTWLESGNFMDKSVTNDLDLIQKCNKVGKPITEEAENPKRKIIKLYFNEGKTIAIGDDGTIWRLDNERGCWYEFPPIPQEEV